MARKGFQLVYGATANLFVDRHGEYIGYGPEAAELVGLPEPETFQVLPWDPKVARVWCTCFRGREDIEDGGSYLTADCRNNLKLIQAEFTETHGHAPARRPRARDDLAQGRRGRHADVRGHVEALLLPHRPVQPVPADHPQGDRVRERDGPGHDPGRSRGRAGPARAELQLRRRREDGRQPLHLPPGLQAGRARDAGLPVLHAQALHGRLGQRLPPQHLALGRRRQQVHARAGRGSAHARPDRQVGDRRHPRAPRRADRDHRLDGQLLPPALGHGLLGAGLRRLGLPEPHDRAARLGPGPLRVPLGRLRRQPVPLAGRADQGHGGRHPAQARSGPARGAQHLPGHGGRQGGQEDPDDLRRRARRARRGRGRQERPARTRCTRSSGTTSATSGSATARP